MEKPFFFQLFASSCWFFFLPRHLSSTRKVSVLPFISISNVSLNTHKTHVSTNAREYNEIHLKLRLRSANREKTKCAPIQSKHKIFYELAFCIVKNTPQFSKQNVEYDFSYSLSLCRAIKFSELWSMMAWNTTIQYRKRTKEPRKRKGDFVKRNNRKAFILEIYN